MLRRAPRALQEALGAFSLIPVLTMSTLSKKPRKIAGRRLIIHGVCFNTISAAVEVLGIPRTTIARRCDSRQFVWLEWKWKDKPTSAGGNNARAVIVGDIVYDTQSHASKRHRIPLTTLRRWCKARRTHNGLQYRYAPVNRKSI
jgi:hypothetical protein